MPGWATVFALEETPEGYKKTTLLEREKDQGGAEKGDGKGSRESPAVDSTRGGASGINAQARESKQEL